MTFKKYKYFKIKSSSSNKINFDKDSPKHYAPILPIQLLRNKKFLIISKTISKIKTKKTFI